MQLSSHHRSSILGVAMVFSASAWAGPATPVTATQTPNSISVNNGLIDLEVSRADGIITAIKKFDGKSFVSLGVTETKAAYGARSEDSDGDPETAMYWDANADVPVVPPGLKPLKKGYYRLRPYQGMTQLTVNTPERAEVVTTAVPSPLFPFSVAHHYVVFRGQSGFYAYVILHHSQVDAAATLYQSRFVIKTVMDGTFDQWAIGNGKFVPIPQSAVTQKVTDATYRLADGTIKTKYMNSVYWAQVPVYGYTGKNLGLWMIEPSPEYHNGGPIKQGQTVHDNVLLRVLQSVHFGASPVQVEAGEEWTKTYGPFLVYANQGNSSEALWKDADQQYQQEKTSWPYRWVLSPQYAHERGKVTGNIQLPGKSTAGAWAILSPPAPDWSAENKGYNFWTKVGADGSFDIGKVVPGTYNLYVCGADQPTDFLKKDVTVTANQTTALGALSWTPVTHGTQIFQIGTFDRSAAEFRNGDDARDFQMYLRYPKQFPNDVDFTVGKSDPRVDWNYAHWSIYSHNPSWKVHFTTAPASGNATLTIGFASSQPTHGSKTDLRVRVNGSEVAQINLPKTGTAGYRGGVQDSPYNLRVIQFPASLLKAGENLIELSHADALPYQKYFPDAASNEVPAAGIPGQVMYDAIRLEVDKQ